MAVDSLASLEAAFDDWRRERKHIREPIPGTLIARAQRAASVHSPAAVHRATNIPRRHLAHRPPAKCAVERPSPLKAGLVRSVPAFSRLELSAATSSSKPIAELETPAGFKLRIFSSTPEVIGLVHALGGPGGLP
jgi:hypothetical protein